MNAETLSPPGAASDEASPESEPPEPEDPDPAKQMSGAAEVVTIRIDVPSVDVPWLREHLSRALDHLPRSVKRIDVAVVDDATMQRLHRQHLGLDATTDVLTFETSPSPHDALEVDVAVCVDVARRQAQRQGHRVEQELLLYVVHGLLHCAGYDDHDEAGSAAMHAEEDRILTCIGVGATFAADRATERGSDA